MVALNTAYAAPKNAADPKNRVGDFFYEDRASVGKNCWAKPLNAQEKSSYHYETASGRSNWPNRDPIGEAFRAGDFSLYNFNTNNPINLIDVLGLFPSSPGGEPTYEPDEWNDGGNTQYSNNCYSYACNRPGPRPGPTKPQPGDSSGDRYENVTCEDVKAAALSDGLKEMPSEGCCPEGYHEVSLVVDPNVDYHWYREDQGGGWSHKPGWGPATDVDASGEPITDPSSADRDYSDRGGPNYSEDCGTLCAPN
jgi:hypothetical protein